MNYRLSTLNVLRKFVAFLLLITINAVYLFNPILVLADEASSSAKVENTSQPSPIADSSETPIPSSTPEVSITPEPTQTPQPSQTPEASASASPSIEPIASSSATPNPSMSPIATESATPSPSASASAKIKRHTDKEAGVTREKYVAGEIIVKYKKDRVNIQGLTGKVQSLFFQNKHKLQKQDEIKSLNIEVYKSDKPIQEKIEELKRDPDVEYAEPNYIRYPQYTPNDPSFSKLWALNNTGQDVSLTGFIGKNDADIDAPEAWNLESADQSDVLVAVLDTGVAYNHEDLAGNMWDGTNCKDENNNAVTGGCPNHGWDFEDNDNDPNDDYGHGTHVAGTIAAIANNSKGVVGISSKNNIKVMALKIGFDTFTIAGEVKAINFAKNNGAKVINASFGGGDYSQTEKDAIASFPGLFIAAAGNGGFDGKGDNNDNSSFWPSGYDLPNIISVAATDYLDELAYFSNYGLTSVDVAAPGVNILSTAHSYSSSTLMYENFNSLLVPNIPPGYTKTGDWGTYPINGSVVLYGDVNNIPYKANADSAITSPIIDLGLSEQATFTFYTRCDTQIDSGYTDYMALEVSSDGQNFTEISKWNEADLWFKYSSLHSQKHDTNGGGEEPRFGGDYLAVTVPVQYLTNNFKFRFRWVTNGDDSTGSVGDGCYIDDLSLIGYSPNSEEYEFKQGTSMAAPHVAGEAAMLYSYNSNLSDSQVKNIILNSGDSLSVLAGKTVSGKRINLYNALVQAGQANPSPTPTPSVTPTPTPTSTPTATPTVTPSPTPTPTPNDPPVASDIEVNTNENTSITFNLSVTDADNDSLCYQINTSPSHGQLTLDVATASATPNGGGCLKNPTLTYTPNNNYDGTDSFTYSAYDGKVFSNIATAKINVTLTNHPPVASDIEVNTLEDNSITFDMAVNDPENELLCYSVVTYPTHGQLEAVNNSQNIGINGGCNYEKPTLKYTPYENYHGTDSFTFKGYDKAIKYSNLATAKINVNPVNDAPVTASGSATIKEDTSSEISLSASDIDNDNLTYQIINNPLHGTLSLINGNKVTYTPNKYYNGDDFFTFKAFDGTLSSNISAVRIEIEAVDNAPIASDLTIETLEDKSVNFALDISDPEGNSPSYRILTSPQHGTLTFGEGYLLTYTPHANFYSTDSFTYQASDGELNSNIATVTINVTNVDDVPVAEDLSFTTNEDTIVPILFAQRDLDGEILTHEIVTLPLHGELINPSNNSIKYNPHQNYFGTDSFTYKLKDASSSSNIATVNITVSPVNDGPQAQHITATINEDESISINLLANDNDGDNLTYSIVANPTRGNVGTISGNTVTYTPWANYYGLDSFTFKANDGSLDSNEAAVAITINSINDNPVANDQSVSTNEDNSLTITLSGIDTDNDALTYSLATGVSQGTLSVISGNKITYTPNANFNGTDSFSFRVDDTQSPLGFNLENLKKQSNNGLLNLFGILDSNQSNTATVTITVNPVNDAPVSQNDTASVNEDNTLTLAKSALLTNDTDTDGDNLTITNVSNPAHGTVNLLGDNVIFTSDINFNGQANFDYTVSDGYLTSTARVNITINPVNDAPHAQNQDVSVEEGNVISINLEATDIDSNLLTYTIASNPAHGTLSAINENHVTYTPTAHFNGTDSFTFKASDGSLDSNIATVNITVTPYNDPPVLDPIGNKTVDELTELKLAVSATDLEGSELTYYLAFAPTGASIDPVTGTFSWIPTEAQGPSTYTFRVVARDESKSDSEEISVTVNEVNSAPVASNINTSVNEDDEKVINLEAVDTDIPVNTLTYSIASSSAHGTISLNSNKVTYKPQENYSGADSFTYKVNDGTLDSNIATVYITVSPVNDTPIALDDTIEVFEDQAVSFNLKISDTDGINPYYRILTSPAHGTLTIGEGYSLTYTPHANFYSTDSFTYQANDGELYSNIATITINVTNVDDIPLADDLTIATNEDTIVPVVFAPRDLDGEILTHEVMTNPQHGQLVNPSENSVKYVPGLNYAGKDSFTYKLKDASSSSNIATVNITVNPVNDAPSIIAVDILPEHFKTSTVVTAQVSAEDLENNPITFKFQWMKNGIPIAGETQNSLDLNKSGNGDKGDYINVEVIANDGSLDSLPVSSNKIKVENTAPVAFADTLLTTKDNNLVFPASSLVANDSDIDLSDTLTVTAITALTHGTITLSSGTVTFIPESGYIGQASLLYSLSDGSEEVLSSLVINIIQPLDTGEIILAPIIDLTDSATSVVVGNTNVDSTINVPSNINNATLDTSDIATTTGDTKQANITNNISVNTNSSLGTLNVTIPANTTVSGPSTWNGAITLPTIASSSGIILPTQTGSTSQATSVIEIGAGDTPLTFNKAVRIVIPGKANQLVGFVRGETFTAITNECIADTQANADLLADGADCKINSGNDLVIWTKHFTRFVTYTQTLNNTTPSGGNNTAGSSSNSSSTEAPKCVDAKPGSTPTLISATAGENSVTLTWNKVTDPVTYYLVAYGLDSGKMQFGNPNIGNVTSYTINNLSGGVTYYFKVRAGNNCMPGEYSNELSATPTGGVTTGEAIGFEEGVLAADNREKAATEASQEATSQAQVSSKDNKNNLIWLLVILGLFGSVAITYRLKNSK